MSERGSVRAPINNQGRAAGSRRLWCLKAPPPHMVASPRCQHFVDESVARVCSGECRSVLLRLRFLFLRFKPPPTAAVALQLFPSPPTCPCKDPFSAQLVLLQASGCATAPAARWARSTRTTTIHSVDPWRCSFCRNRIMGEVRQRALGRSCRRAWELSRLTSR